MKGLLDFIPLIIFFYLYQTVDPKDAEHPFLQWFGASGGVDNNHILVATAGLIISMLIVYGTLLVAQKFRLEKQQWLTLVLTIGFGGLTLVFSDDYYIRLKAVVLNLIFAAAFLISPLFFKNGKSLIHKLFSPVLELSEQGWKKLNWAWVIMFATMSGLHAFFAFVFMGGKYWGEFTAFGDMVVMLTFLIAMFVVLRKNFKTPQ